MPGLTDLQRLAIKCGNIPYEDDMVCPKCKGDGISIWDSDRAKDKPCRRCDGLGYVSFERESP